MNDTYLIWDNAAGEFFESYEKGSVEGDVFTTPDIESAKRFETREAAEDFAVEIFTEYAILKWE